MILHRVPPDEWYGGPGYPTPRNTVPIRHRRTGQYVRPSCLDRFWPGGNPGVKTTADLAAATHYMPEDVPAVLEALGPEYAA